MKKTDKFIDNKIYQNIFVWVVMYLIFVTSVQGGNRFVMAFYINLFFAPPIYISNLLILPLLNKKKGLFIVFSILNILVFSITISSIMIYFKEDAFSIKTLINFIGIMILAVLFGATLKIARDSFVRRQKEKEAELQLLKAQLNPHFLFNTLNNLYGLSVLKSDKLPNLMLKLSDLLRYSLYETKEMLVPLENEIKYLENYISLEKIRLEDKTEIKFTKTGNFIDKKIAPMLLIVYVENAFKHLDLTTENSKVIIEIKLKDNQFLFNCENSFDVNNNLEKGKSGIGLLNAKKRLDLIYPNNHQLKIKKDTENYLVNLTLDL